MTIKPIPEGFHTVTPYLIVQEADNLIEFVKQAFGTTELTRSKGSAGGIHAEVRIGDSIIMISNTSSEIAKYQFASQVTVARYRLSMLDYW